MLSGYGVRLGTWSLAQYASIPGLSQPFGFTNLTNLAPSGYLGMNLTPTPLGRMCSLFSCWKGSLKYSLQFFASAFTSARLAVYMRPGTSPSTNYDDHIVKIIDIKGDTTVSFTVPFVSHRTWYTGNPPFTLIYALISPIVGSDAALDPVITMVSWVAGGPDVQFALEKTPGTWNMPALAALPSSETVLSSKTRRLLRTDASPAPTSGASQQSAVQTHFANDPFPPIVEGCSYLVDNGYSITDVPVTFNDLLKRFRWTVEYLTYKYYTSVDYTLVPHSMYLNNFGAIRGGYMQKIQINDPTTPTLLSVSWPVETVLNSTSNTSICASVADSSGWHNNSFPYVHPQPFILRDPLAQFSRVQLSTPTTHVRGLIHYAFRDDVELGLPVLPVTGQ